MPKTEPIPPDEATPATADWNTMAQINNVLMASTKKYVENFVRTRKKGIDIVTMFMAVHNFHAAMLIDMAAKIAPGDPLARKAFYMNARDTFDRRMNELIREMEDILLASAIAEAEKMQDD